MDEQISIAVAGNIGNKYIPMIRKLGNEICFCYGIGSVKDFSENVGLENKMRLTKIPSRISAFVIKPIVSVFKLPGYYPYMARIILCDLFFCKKVATDKSKIVFINPLLCRTAEKCKKKGKLVVCEAGNSEPEREYNRISKEYQKYGIHKKYIYGNPAFKKRIKRSFDAANKIITLSKISEKTYVDAGYDKTKLKLIPLTGTDFQPKTINNASGKEKAFISTAFHSFIKGTHSLLLAWRKAQIKDIKLYIVGNLHDDIKEFVNKEGPFENIVFVGHIADLSIWYDQFDAVGVQLSLSEGAPRVIPEMMSFGFPMIVSSDATCDLVVNGINGKIVNPYDIDEIAKNLNLFALDWNNVYAIRGNVLQTIQHRTVSDFSLELGEYLKELSTIGEEDHEVR